MSTLLHVSDMHFGAERPDVVDALVRFARKQRPDLLIISGDITQRARRKQFAAARSFVDALCVANVLAIPGNHDIPLFDLWSRIFAPYAGYTRCFGTDLEPVYESEHVLVIGVNTTRAYRHKHGELSPTQIDRVAKRLRSSRGKFCVIVTHQPLHVMKKSDEVDLVRGHDAALLAWSHAGAHLVLSGHIHLPHIAPVSGVWSVSAGTAVSQRVRGDQDNSVNVIRHNEGICQIERWDFAPHGEFVQKRKQDIFLKH